MIGLWLGTDTAVDYSDSARQRRGRIMPIPSAGLGVAVAYLPALDLLLWVHACMVVYHFLAMPTTLQNKVEYLPLFKFAVPGVREF